MALIQLMGVAVTKCTWNWPGSWCKLQRLPPVHRHGYCWTASISVKSSPIDLILLYWRRF